MSPLAYVAMAVGWGWLGAVIGYSIGWETGRWSR